MIDRRFDGTAELFKALSSVSRLRLVRLLAESPLGVSALVEQTGMSQPLVSQQLRVLRAAGVCDVERSGRDAVYRLADHHVAHIVDDAIAHTTEPEGELMTDTDTQAEHTVTEHEHGADCGHEAVAHEGHTDYLHGLHHHAQHGDHYDEHESRAEHGIEEHEHAADCGHDAVPHDDHVDYQHDGHLHAEHAGHYDEH